MLSLIAAFFFADVVPLARAHSHNDYAQPKPLFGALELGFCSIEADVFLVDGKLLVGHDRKDLSPDRELESMYLKPLADRIQRNGSSVYAKPAEVILLVDIKADGPAVYDTLKSLLKPYERILSSLNRGKVERKALTIILSGNRPVEVLAKEETRYAFIDGRPPDLERTAPTLIPLISTSWTSEFKWRGEGDIPPEERAKLQSMAQKAHRHGQKLRFWASPEVPALWKALRDADVDLIGTDRQPELARFLSGKDRGIQDDTYRRQRT